MDVREICDRHKKQFCVKNSFILESLTFVARFQFFETGKFLKDARKKPCPLQRLQEERILLFL